MNIGYACLALGVPGSELKSCTLKNAQEERLVSLIGHNLDSLNKLIDYNIRSGIKLFRISSDLIPFGSSVAEDLPWQDIYAETLTSTGRKILDAGMRVSMHPGQYTVLNSRDRTVVDRARRDLDYHAKVLDCLGLGPRHKIVLHVGGVYGDKRQALKRFVSHYRHLDSAVQSRLVLENDDRSFHIGDVLETAMSTGSPVVYDNLHNAVNPVDKSCKDLEWITRCRETWQEDDGCQKIHFSQQHPHKRPGAHSDSIRIDAFLDFHKQLSGEGIDIMLEVKDKNVSALKCINCLSNMEIGQLEPEWERYKYCILERSPDHYYAIQRLLRGKGAHPALEMYRMIETSLGKPVVIGHALNAAQHVWGYLKGKDLEAEKKRIQSALMKLEMGQVGIDAVKNTLWRLARKYEEDYLLKGYYFYL